MQGQIAEKSQTSVLLERLRLTSPILEVGAQIRLSPQALAAANANSKIYLQMQDQSVCDIGDFAKYSLLNAVTAAGKTHLGVIWYLNHPRDQNNDGRFVYSWCVSQDLNVELERAARMRKTSLSAVLDEAARDWLKSHASGSTEDERQQRIYEAASKSFGAFASGNPRNSQSVTSTIHEKLARRYGR